MKIQEAWVATIARIKQMIHEEQNKRWLQFKALLEQRLQSRHDHPKDYHDK